MYGTSAVQGTYLTVDAAFCKAYHESGGRKEEKAVLYCRRKEVFTATYSTNRHITGTRRAVIIRISRLCSLHICNAPNIMHFVRNL